MSEIRKEFVHLLANYGHVGFTFVSAIVVGFAGGIFVDEKFFSGKTTPWFTFIGLAFGIAAGYKVLIELIWQAKSLEKQEEVLMDEQNGSEEKR